LVKQEIGAQILRFIWTKSCQQNNLNKEKKDEDKKDKNKN